MAQKACLTCLRSSDGLKTMSRENDAETALTHFGVVDDHTPIHYPQDCKDRHS